MPGRPVFDGITRRRSIRRFIPASVDASELVHLCEAAFFAPAPHHTIPWRFAVVVDVAAKARLAKAMAARWIEDMRADGVDETTAQQLASQSVARLCSAPALILACLVADDLDEYSDERRQRAEWGMAQMSLGAALQNLMLAASEAGYGSCWVAAPIFAPEEAQRSLELPPEWVPQALLMIGRPDPSYAPRPRPKLDLATHTTVI
jgi:coenzyme F420-0:L-glutamate ligase/coenzyme F420-1:gamma-L-glutamate ligase